MLKQALFLWKKEQNTKGTTLHRRLVLFFVLISVILILAFTLLLTLAGITGNGEKAIQNHMNTELAIIADSVADDFGNASLNGITLSENISKRCDDFFAANKIAPQELSSHPELIEPLLAEQMQLLISTVNSRYCGGAFIMLDATVNPSSQNAETMKSGIFLKKTQPTSTEVVGVALHCLRGPAQIARDNGIMLLGQWKMEYNITHQEFFTHVMNTARENPDLPLSRLYYWSGRITLKGNSEAGFLLCVPLRSQDGTVFGLCGIEVSDRLFKSMYSPEGGDYENIFIMMSPSDGKTLYTSQGLIAGNYHLTGNRWKEDVECIGVKDGFERFASEKERYGGLLSPVRLYPNGSPYEEAAWSVAIMMPQALLNATIKGNTASFIYIVIALLAVSILASVLISRRYLRPVEEEISRLHQEKNIVQSQYDQAQTYITHLADERMPEVDADSFDAFLQYLDTLTQKERLIFDLYLEGKKTKEIMEIAGINQNTLKYHNKNIYSKLGVSSRKQLLEYAALMKYKKKD